MQLWTNWLEILQAALLQFSTIPGVGTGAAIILLTIALRVLLLPVSWRLAYRGCIRGKKLRTMQPELQELKARFGNEPSVLAEKTFGLYRDRGVSFFEWRTLFGTLAQMPVFLGMFQILRSGAAAGRFLWVSSLSRPDILIAVIAGITTAVMIAANADIPEQTRIIMITLPSILAFVFALKFASALAVYWIASNVFTAVHTASVHFVVERRIRNGSIAIGR